MMNKSNMSNEEKDYMNQIMVIERKLKKMKQSYLAKRFHGYIQFEWFVGVKVKFI